MTSPPGLLSMNRISTRCQINSSLNINADCNRFVERCNNESKSKHLGKVVLGLCSSYGLSEMFQLFLAIFYHAPILSRHSRLKTSCHRSAFDIVLLTS